MPKLIENRLAPDTPLKDINGHNHWVGRRNIQLANVGQKTVLSFYREASCAFCNYRIYQLSQQMDKLSSQNVRLINVFVSEKQEIERVFHRQCEDKKMIMVSDPDRQFYRSYGVQSAKTADKMKAIFGRVIPLVKGNMLLMQSGANIEPDSHILPADFLINTDGYIETAYYGRDIGDHLPLKQLFAFAESTHRLLEKT